MESVELGTGRPESFWTRRRVGVVTLIALLIVLVIAWWVTRPGEAPDGADPGPKATTTATTSSDAATSLPTEKAGTSTPGAGDPDAPESSEAPGDSGGGQAPAGARPTAPAVGVDQEAVPQEGVVARVERVESVEGEANLPGEIGGPSLRVTVQVQNDTSVDLDLTSAVVNLAYGDATVPAITLSGPGVEVFPRSVAPGRAASSVWVFNVPADDRDLVTIELDVSADATVVLFSGDVSDS